MGRACVPNEYSPFPPGSFGPTTHPLISSHPTPDPAPTLDMEQPVVASADEKKAVDPEVSSSSRGDGADDGLINASGHHQELERNFSLVSMCSYAITAGNTWVSLGGTIVCLPRFLPSFGPPPPPQSSPEGGLSPRWLATPPSRGAIELTRYVEQTVAIYNGSLPVARPPADAPLAMVVDLADSRHRKGGPPGVIYEL